MNVRRERHGADAGKDILEHAVEMKIDDALARFRPVFDGEEKLFGNDEFGADFRFFARLYEHFPFGEVAPFQKQDFDLAAVLRVGVHARGQDLCVVDDKHVARLQIFFDVAENAVFRLARLAVIDQKARRIARLGGSLRDEFFGQFIKIIGFF